MAARNRPRVNHIKDNLDEERHIWNTIVTHIKKLRSINVAGAEISIQIVAAEKDISGDPAPPVQNLDDLDKLYRDGVRLAEEEQKILNDGSDEEVIKQLGILIALRTASELDALQNLPVAKPRNPKRKLDFDGAIDSPAPSPSVSIPASRIISKAASRSGSVPAAREVSVKIEDGASDTPKSGGPDKARLTVGAEVCYRTGRNKEIEGEGMLCLVTNVIGDGKQRRYEIQDADPDPEPDAQGKFPPPHRAPVSLLIPIPASNANFPDLQRGKQVLALYPGTTTFYRAEIVGTRREVCRLKFEGEEEGEQDKDVERRYVLDALR